MSTVSKNTALNSLRKLVEKSLKITSGTLEHLGWLPGARTAIARIFGNPSAQLSEFSRWTNLVAQRAVLESLISEVEDFWEDEQVPAPMSDTPVKAPAGGNEIKAPEQASRKPCVFIGHGQSPVWARLQLFLDKNLGLDTVNYESEPRAGESIVPILEKMLEQATFAVLILTAEDETASGARRARQNVIHEAGLFQGRLGFKKAILLRQEGTEDFSNVAGLQHISFDGDRIDQIFWQLQEVLIREGQLVK